MSAKRILAFVCLAVCLPWSGGILMGFCISMNLGFWPTMGAWLLLNGGILSALAAVAPLPPREDAAHASRKGGEK